MTSTVRVERTGSVAKIVLNRPEAGNAIDLQMAERLSTVAIQVDCDASIHCVVLTGAGKLFCGGGDVRSFAAAGEGAPELIKAITGNLHSAIARLMRMEKPLITAVNGPAGGAGFSLACLGDLVIAADTAHFTAGYCALGLSPDGALTWTLPRLVGVRKAQELIYQNRRVSADEAVSLGIVTKACPAYEFPQTIDATAKELAEGPRKAFGAVRRLLLGAQTSPLETHMEWESEAIASLAGTSDGREGVSAFVEKRPARFTGGASA